MMKFDADSIDNRISSKLNENPDWKPMIANSVMSSMIRHNAEADAEIARYAEYLFNESRNSVTIYESRFCDYHCLKLLNKSLLSVIVEKTVN